MDETTTVGIDLAKEVFAVCVLDARGAVLERKVLRRASFERWAAALSRCTVANGSPLRRSPALRRAEEVVGLPSFMGSLARSVR